MARSQPPPHAGCPRGDPGPLPVLTRTRPYAASGTLALQSNAFRKHSGHSRQLLQIQNVRDENRPRVEGSRSAAVAGAFRKRLHQLTQIPGDWLSESRPCRLKSRGDPLRRGAADL